MFSGYCGTGYNVNLKFCQRCITENSSSSSMIRADAVIMTIYNCLFFKINQQFKLKFILMLPLLIFLLSNFAFAEASLKVCINSKGQIIARKKCIKGMATLNASYLATQGQSGAKGDPGKDGISPASLGVISGKVLIFESPCNPVPVDPKKHTLWVFLDGTSYKSSVDDEGNFVISDVIAGAYMVKIERTGTISRIGSITGEELIIDKSRPLLVDPIQVSEGQQVSLGTLTLNFISYDPKLPCCGNGIVEQGEACDPAWYVSTPAVFYNNLTCSSFGKTGGNLICNSCRQVLKACSDSLCGNGIREDEQCDGNDFGTDGNSCSIFEAHHNPAPTTFACKSDCTRDYSPCFPGRVCGNGVRETPLEACDGLDFGGNDVCPSGHGTKICLADCTVSLDLCP